MATASNCTVIAELSKQVENLQLSQLHTDPAEEISRRIEELETKKRKLLSHQTILNNAIARPDDSEALARALPILVDLYASGLLHLVP